ncbi:UDP-3-O-[3-hydroxymyristoyl] glucosamine N-acyltransferase [Parelusimicrobium proximum]|uniref:UDP-3-O-(3-hydroxymyristoyl)glucosamine N-acyltransferase n=1 Tax=Parelusimicrobium proximum TaxID=3228953 RepID=UPI003D178134
MHITLAEVSKITGGELAGKEDFIVKGVCSLDNIKEDAVCYISNLKKVDLTSIKAGCVILHISEKGNVQTNLNVIYADNPEWAFTKLVRFIDSLNPNFNPGIHPTAVIDPSAKIGLNVSIGAYCVVEKNVTIGDDCIIHPHVFIGRDTSLGKNCIIHNQVTIREEVIIKDNVVVQAGARIGTDGFGFVMINGKHEKIPQIGNVIIESDVEIGANTTIDRAKIDSTYIGQNVKIDNLVQIAHNVQIGMGSIIISQVGIAGSTKLGMYVVLAGQVGVAGHLNIGDTAQVGAKSGILGNIPAGGKYIGLPARPITDTMKIWAVEGKLPEINKDIRELKKLLKKDEGK